jgi:sigma-54 dependent transcriptional regulator, acetoin dehydrogenase operon transcriptional activator AcoR
MHVRSDLMVVTDASHPLDGGMRVNLDGIRELFVGRGEIRRVRNAGEGCLALEVPNPSMSASHFRLIRKGLGYIAVDGSSRNGTWLHGERRAEFPLEDGTVFDAGRTLFLFRQTEVPAMATERVRGMTELATLPVGLRTLAPNLALQFERLLRVARSRVSVLVLGPTGAGKELVAKAIHERSARKGAFVAVNCGAIPPTLVESSLFGHSRGAFSGALRDEPGLVRSADGGTLFLDEIADLPPASQAALLRVLQESEVVPVGASKPVKVDVRVIAATHKPIDALAASGMFRVDLLARLRGYTCTLPPLQDRREDLGVMLAHILPTVAGTKVGPFEISPSVARALLQYSFPENGRELAQMLSAAVAIAEDGKLESHMFPPSLFAAPRTKGSLVPSGSQGSAGDLSAKSGSAFVVPATPCEPLSDQDAALLEGLLVALRTERGNVAGVARTMGKAPNQIHRWMRRFGVEPDSFRQ